MKAISKSAQAKEIRARIFQEGNNDALIALAKKYKDSVDDMGRVILASVIEVLESRGSEYINICETLR